MRRVHVPLGARSYSILIAPGLLAQLGPRCAQLRLGQRCAILTDSNVAAHYAEQAETSLRQAGFDPIVVPVKPGEKSKRLEVVHSCYNALAEHRLERASFIVALGGGVVGDLAGFVAATYLRGLPFVQVPTTLLAQVDSSVGGKVGVNLKAGKNLVGAFHQPRLVLCDLNALKTLSARELKAGLAEVIKYGVIYDASFFRQLERDLDKILAGDEKTRTAIIARCCQIKAEVVGQDETESGLRAILNFGHTIGHALEAISRYGKFLHGEAIAIGQTSAARISTETLGLPVMEADRIENLLARAGLPTRIRLSPRQKEQLLSAMRLDKKVSGGEIRFVLAQRIGWVEFGRKVPLTVLEKHL